MNMILQRTLPLNPSSSKFGVREYLYMERALESDQLYNEAREEVIKFMELGIISGMPDEDRFAMRVLFNYVKKKIEAEWLETNPWIYDYIVETMNHHARSLSPCDQPLFSNLKREFKKLRRESTAA